MTPAQKLHERVARMHRMAKAVDVKLTLDDDGVWTISIDLFGKPASARLPASLKAPELTFRMPSMGHAEICLAAMQEPVASLRASAAISRARRGARRDSKSGGQA